MRKQTIIHAIGMIEDAYLLEVMKYKEWSNRKSHIGKRKSQRITSKARRVVGLVAVIAALLVVTAVAIYQYTMKDAAIKDMPDRSVPGKTENLLSLNGFSDSPEYQAYVEWESWNREWLQENRNWHKEEGQDDSYYETSQNYAAYYQAYASEQGEKLDEVLAEYDLAPHSDREGFTAERTLCDILGTEDLFDDQYGLCSGYIYEDGSFKAEIVLAEAPSVWVVVHNAVHGSFSSISSRAMSEYEEWSYVTADGTELILAADSHQSRIIGGLEGSYVHVSISEGYTREELQSLADGINFAALNKRFGASSSAGENILTGWRESQTGVINTDETTGTATELLGDWWIVDLPEGAELEKITSTIPDVYSEHYRVSRHYDYNGAIFTLSCYELDLADDVGEKGRLSLDTYTEGAYRSAREFGDKLTECEVQGYEALLIDYGSGNIGLIWIDTENELRFEINANWGGYFGDVHYWTGEEILSMAESVQGTPAAEPLRRSAPTREEKLAMNVTPLVEDVHSRPTTEQELEALSSRGMLPKLTLPDTFSSRYAYGNESEYWGTGEYLEQYTAGITYQLDNYMVKLQWDRYMDEDGNNRSYDVFTDDRDELIANWGDEGLWYTCEVNGHKAYATESEWDHTLVWMDEERDVIVRLESNPGLAGEPENPERFTVEELMDIASQVTETESSVPFLSESANDYATTKDVMERMGAYVATELPEGIANPRVVQGYMLDETTPAWYLESYPCCEEAVFTVYEGGLELTYTRYWSDNTRTQSINASSFADMQIYYPLCDSDAVTTGLSVNGHPAMLVDIPAGMFHAERTDLIWLDTEADMIFTLAAYDEYVTEQLTQQDLICIAESVMLQEEN